MATSLKRFTISVTPKMESDLDVAKRKLYYKDNQNAMIRDLICRGLASLEEEYQRADTQLKPEGVDR